MVRRWTRMIAIALAGAVAPACLAHAQKGVPPTSVLVGGQAMVSDRDIMDNLQKSPELSTFVSLLHTAGLSDSLQGHGPFTVFAPINPAFNKVPAEQLDALRRPDNRAKLAALMGANILEGNFSSSRLRYLLRQNKGSVDLDTVSGGKLTIILNGPQNIMVKDAKGHAADIVVYDVKQANGVLFVTDAVMQPD